MNNFKDLEQWVSDQLSNYDMTQYMNLDDLVECISSDYLAEIRRKYNFTWGDPIFDNLDGLEFEEIMKNYEKQ